MIVRHELDREKKRRDILLLREWQGGRAYIKVRTCLATLWRAETEAGGRGLSGGGVEG